MADGVEITPGTGTVIATDDVGGVQYQYTKLDQGGNGVSSPVTAASPLGVAPIAGQVGVQGGAGVATATTQRVVNATDDPATVSLAVMDDWDESDRAKVNLIAAQAGVDGGAGNASAKTQRVVIATDQLPVDVDIVAGTVTITTGSATATLSNAADSAASAQLLAANANRKGFYVYNDSTVDLYLKFGTTASATSFTQKLAAATGWGDAGIGVYQGRIDGVWASDASGSSRSTEW